MNEVRYQVFVSSTYADLQSERSNVIKALLQIDCIPAGMELFPASNEEQFSFIKRVIDLSDYYVLIIGGRYGSITNDGISYTELEYEYAQETGKPICAFVHSDPGAIALAKTDGSEILTKKLNAFRDKVCRGRLVKMWANSHELPGHVVISLTQAIKTYPSPGWIRGDQGASVQLYKELDDLRKENSVLRKAPKSTSKKTTSYDDMPVDLVFRKLGEEVTERRTLKIKDIVRIVPTSKATSTLSNRIFADMISEHVFGFEESISYIMTDKSIDDIVFILDQVGFAVPHDGYIGFTTKFGRVKANAEFGIES